MIDHISGELANLLWQRQQIRMISDMIEANAQLQQSDKSFLFSARDWYLAYAAMTIRRQNDLNEKRVSLKQLLTKMRDNPGCITRQLPVTLAIAGSTFRHQRASPSPCVATATRLTSISRRKQSRKTLSAASAPTHAYRKI